MSRRDRDRSRSLVDQATGPGELGPPIALLATTFDLAPDFVETDFLPSVMRVPSADDRTFRSRMQLEAALGRASSVALLCDARCYRGRPASLRVHVTPRIAPRAGYLHAKVTLAVHEDAVRLLVGSANLTVNGYRHNREVAFSVTAEKKSPDATRFVRDAVAAMRAELEPWWSDAAEAVARTAEESLTQWPVKDASEDERFVWSGPRRRLWQEFVDAWPEDEAIQSVTIVSPYWSEEEPGSGVLERFVRALRVRSKTKAPLSVTLVTPASPTQGGTHLPTLPASFRGIDPAAWGASVEAVPAQPYVASDDDVKIASGARHGDGTTIVERRLHAKVVIVEGKTTTLAYAGSANFTSPGWGFDRAEDIHVEAGVILRRRRSGRDALRALVPPLAGKPVPLGKATSAVLATPCPEEDAAGPWPTFLRDLRLVPTANDTELALVLGLDPSTTPPSWSIAYDEAQQPAHSWTGAPPSAEVTVALSASELEAIIRRKSVFVRWGEVGTWVPVNVALEARAQIPFGDGARPGENELIAFFQGKLAIEDVFPPSGDDELDGPASHAEAVASSVDTSKILSYQIRSFVEALPGLRQVLLRDSSTPSSIRMSILGPISPVALAKEIVRAAEQGRSPVAAGFQLVELRNTLRTLRGEKVPDRVRDVWVQTLGEAEQRVAAMSTEVRAKASAGSGATFDRYSAAVLGHGGVS